MLDTADGSSDVLAPRLHVVVGTDTNRLDRLLGSDDMFHGRDEFGREAAVGHQHQSDHSFNSPSLSLSGVRPGCRSIVSLGGAARSRWRTFGAKPELRKRSAISTAAATDRCRPPVQPNATVT